MRMFLVGMCDIFLILYLTTLGQVDRSRVSDLTVSDYLELRLLADERRQEVLESEQRLASLQGKLKKQLSEMQVSGDELLELQKRLKSEELVRRQGEKESRDSLNKLKSLEEQKRKILQEQEEISAALERELAEKQALSESVSELKSSIAESIAEREKADELVATLKSSEENARDAEQRAKEEAEDAKRLALEAKREKEEALQEAQEARQLALDANERKQVALARAREASGVALEARINAIKARETAKRQTQVAKRVSTELKAVIEPAKKAYSDRVIKVTQKVKIDLEIQNRLIGTSKETHVMRLLTAKWKGERLLFIPFDQASLREVSDIGRFVRYQIAVDGKSVKKMYVRPGLPSIIAFVAPDSQLEGLKLEKGLKAASLTPTLFAVRNGSRMKFSDRMRNLDEDYFVFKRDRLMTRAGLLSLSVDGFRGTRDYGERIVSGDQIVDLRGNLVGIATAENTVLLLDGLESWVPVDLDPKAPSAALNSLWVARGK